MLFKNKIFVFFICFFVLFQYSLQFAAQSFVTAPKKMVQKKPSINARKKVERIEARYQKIVDESKNIKVSDIVLENKNLKKGEFLFGLGSSSYQVEGPDGAPLKVSAKNDQESEEKKVDKKSDKNFDSTKEVEYEKYSHWQLYNGKKVEMDIDNKKEFRTIIDPGNACQHWIRYKEDIKLLKDMGCNAYRFSISWGKVMTSENEFSQQALAHYEDVCRELQRNGIRPVITLYHYAHPVWFENKGAFEKDENVKYFVDFGLKVFEKLNKFNPMWFTINSFEGAMHSHYMGTKAPFKKDMNIALKVLKNLLNGHVEFYVKAKKLAKELKQESTIGIYKIIFPIEKYRSLQFWDGIGVSFVEKINNNAIFDFFSKGVLDLNIGISVLGIKSSVYCKNKDAIGAFDCLGLNYYTGAYMSNFKVYPHKDRIPSQSALVTVYPEGFYTAIKTLDKELATKFNKPIYITENGIPTDNDVYRDVYYRTHLSQLSKAMNEGIDVRGYIVWSFLDSWDWLEGYNFTYGVFSVDRETQKRTLKPGADFLLKVIKNNAKDKLQKQDKTIKLKNINMQDKNLLSQDKLCENVFTVSGGSGFVKSTKDEIMSSIEKNAQKETNNKNIKNIENSLSNKNLSNQEIKISPNAENDFGKNKVLYQNIGVNSPISCLN